MGWVATQAAVFWHLLSHTFAHFEAAPREPGRITDASPSGTFEAEHIALCQAIFDEQDKRQERLEGKAQVVQGVVAVLAPLLIGLLVFVLTPDSGLTSISLVLAFAIPALALGAVALVASLRAVGVRRRHSLNVGAVVKVEAASVSQYTADRHARGLLWCAAMNDAMNDHVADFVRSAQAFLILAVITGGTAGVVAALSFHPERDGTDAAMLRQATQAADDLDGIRAVLDDQSRGTAAEIEALKVQIEDLQRQAAAARAPAAAMPVSPGKRGKKKSGGP